MQDVLVDFHLHTTCSDGAWSPGRLFDEIRKRALSHFSVTDHDNMDAYPVPRDLQESCIAGLEIDTYGFDQTIHVLAYGVRRRDGSLLARLKQQQTNRSVRARLIVERLNQLGVGLTFDQVLDEAKTSKSVGRPHIARALVASRHCGSMQDAFDEYLAEGRSAYVGLDRLAVSEAIQLIHAEGALAILAHPRRLRNQNNVREFCTLLMASKSCIRPPTASTNVSYLTLLIRTRSLQRGEQTFMPDQVKHR